MCVHFLVRTRVQSNYQLDTVLTYRAQIIEQVLAENWNYRILVRGTFPRGKSHFLSLSFSLRPRKRISRL